MPARASPFLLDYFVFEADLGGDFKSKFILSFTILARFSVGDGARFKIPETAGGPTIFGGGVSPSDSTEETAIDWSDQPCLSDAVSQEPRLMDSSSSNWTRLRLLLPSDESDAPNGDGGFERRGPSTNNSEKQLFNAE